MPKRDPTVDFANADPLIWATRNIVLHHGGPWDFSDRAWQAKILSDTRPEQVFMKPTQVGMTTVATVRALHFMDTHPGVVIYSLPRRDDVRDYVSIILDPLIDNSPYLQRRIISNSTRIKRIGVGTLMLSESSVPPRMIPAQFVINDEWDLSDMENVTLFRRRLDASPVKRHIRLSVPQLPNTGIQVLFDHSTAAEWHFKCWHCGKWQTLSFEHNIAQPADGKPYYMCSYCHRALEDDNIQDGEWVEAHPDADVAGYHISQMMMPKTHPAHELVFEYQTSLNVAQFYRNNLGLPYSANQVRISAEQIREVCFQSGHPRAAAPLTGASYYLGADQGNDIYAVIIQVDPSGVMKLVDAARIPFEGADGFALLDMMMERWKPRMAVIDMLPNRHSARNLVRRHFNNMRAAYYTEASLPDVWAKGKDNDTVAISRTDMFDSLMLNILDGKLQFWGRAEPMDNIISTIVSHITSLVRDEVIRTKTASGPTMYPVWRSTGADHFAHAIGYALVASMIGPANAFKISAVNIGEDAQEMYDDAGDEHEDAEPADLASVMKGVLGIDNRATDRADGNEEELSSETLARIASLENRRFRSRNR